MEHECVIIDLIEVRLKKYVDTFHQGSEAWDIAMQVLLMYLSGEIDISWNAKGIKVVHPSSELKKKNPRKEYKKSSVILPTNNKKEQ